MMETNPQGWKTRQARARARRMGHGVSPEERQRIREIRRRHAEEIANPAEPVVVAKPEPAPKFLANGLRDPDSMTWQQMADELRKAGKFVPPKIGEEKLRQRLREKRDAETAEAG